MSSYFQFTAIHLGGLIVHLLYWDTQLTVSMTMQEIIEVDITSAVSGLAVPSYLIYCPNLFLAQEHL